MLSRIVPVNLVTVTVIASPEGARQSINHNSSAGLQIYGSPRALWALAMTEEKQCHLFHFLSNYIRFFLLIIIYML
jgi:hypothetical protein